MNPVRANVLGVFLTILGLLQVCGFVAAYAGIPHAQSLIRLGQGVAVSPLPTPFRDNNGYENFASYRTYDIVLSDGTTRSLTDQDFGHILPGPHRRVVPYFNSLAMIPRLPETLSMSILRYLFCKSDFPMYHGLATEENPIAGVSIRVSTYTLGRESVSWQYAVDCRL